MILRIEEVVLLRLVRKCYIASRYGNSCSGESMKGTPLLESKFHILKADIWKVTLVVKCGWLSPLISLAINFP